VADETKPDDREPTPEQQAELRAAYAANEAKGKPPYWHVEIRTRGELRWILKERSWSGEGIAFERERVDLSGADLARANLRGMHLRGANLSGTRLREANLRGAVLRAVRMDMATVLIDIALDTNTWLGDVAWNGAQLTRVDWTQAPMLGDEQAIKEAKKRRECIEAVRYAARAYHGLAVALREQGVAIPASGYRLREQRLERRALRLERKYGAWFFSGLLDLVAGYGERPGRILISYVAVVASFAAAYWAVTHYLETQLSKLRWDEALVLSLTSFHGRGFFPGFLSLGDWVARLGAAEAVIGLFIELILIATFSRRFLGN
jgi:Pentapeptide repeats (8 copies)